MSNVESLGRVPFFSILDHADLTELAAGAQRRKFPARQVIFYADDPGSTLYLIESGRVKIVLPSEEGEEVILALLGPGDFFGEMSLFDGRPRSATAVASEPTEVMMLTRDHFLAVVERHPKVALSIISALSQRLRRADEMVGDVIFLDLPTRLIKKILELADQRGERTSEGIAINVRLTQQDLGDMIGASRESINKHLGYFESKGLLRYERQHLFVLRPDKLKALV